jgi:hypothetical protein
MRGKEMEPTLMSLRLPSDAFNETNALRSCIENIIEKNINAGIKMSISN